MKYNNLFLSYKNEENLIINAIYYSAALAVMKSSKTANGLRSL